MCYAPKDEPEEDIDGVCKSCEKPTIEGRAFEMCGYSPEACKECGYSPCAGHC